MAKELPPEVEQMIAELSERFREELREIVSWSYGDEEPTLAEIEKRIREWIREIGQNTQKLTVGQMDRVRAKGRKPCPRCGELTSWKRYEPRRLVTTLGVVQIERAYYYHQRCHCGWVPLDERLGLGKRELSPLVQEMTGYLGALLPYERASKYLSRYLGIDVSHDTVNNMTVWVGSQLLQEQRKRVERVWSGAETVVAPKDAPDRLYVSADGINHLLANGQGKELKVATIYETEERQNKEKETEIHARDLEYVVASEAQDLAKAAYVAAMERGLEEARERIVLGDGAQWIWNRVASALKVPDCTEILDYYHATEYIWGAAECSYGTENEAGKAWAKEVSHQLKEQGPDPVMQQLRELAVPKHASAQPIMNALAYIEKRVDKMDYPSYRQRGLQIGSGSAESGVLQVVGARLNQPGMRWNEERGESVAQARAAILSKRWAAFWENHQTQYRTAKASSVRLA